MSALGRVSAPGGPALGRGVTAPGGGLLPEGSAPGACSGGGGGGVCFRGGLLSQHALRQTPR